MGGRSVVVDREFPSAVQHITHVAVGSVVHTDLLGGRNHVDQVLRHLVVIVHAHRQRVVEQLHVESGAGLYGRLPTGIEVRDRRKVGSGDRLVETLTEDTGPVVGQQLSRCSVVLIQLDVTHFTPACTELHQVEHLVEAGILEEFFRREFPRTGNRREPVVGFRDRQLRRRIATNATYEEITVVERITHTGQDGIHRVVVLALLGFDRPVVGVVPQQVVLLLGIVLREDAAAVCFFGIGGETGHGADVVLAEELGPAYGRLRQPVAVAVKELLAVALRTHQTGLLHDGIELVLLLRAQVGGKFGPDGQRRDRLDFQRCGRENLVLRILAVKPFEISHRVVNVGGSGYAGPFGRGSAEILVALLVECIASVLVHLIDGSEGGIPHGAHDRTLVAGVHVALAVRGAERNALREFQPFGQLEVRLQLTAEALAVGVEQHALGLVIGKRKHRLDLLAASGDRGCIVLLRTRLENLVQPVRARHVTEREQLGIHRRRKRLAARVVVDGFLPYRIELLGIQQVGKARNLLNAVRNVDIHANLAALGLFRRDQHNAARTYRSAVDSG